DNLRTRLPQTLITVRSSQPFISPLNPLCSPEDQLMQTHEGHARRRLRLTITGIIFFLITAALASTSSTTRSATPASATYVIDNQKGKFIAHAFAGGLFWFKGHDHYLAA